MENKILKAIEALDNKFEKELKFLRTETKEELKLLRNQTKENTQILQALQHSAEVNKAEHDQMMIKLSKVEGSVEHVKIDVTGLRKDLSTMEIVTANNYADIAKLKAVK